MSILSEVKKRRMSAMKEKRNDPENDNGTREKLSTYTTLLGEFERVDKEIQDQRAAGIINGMIDNANAMIADLENRGGNESKIGSIKIEVETLTELLPKSLSVDDLLRIKSESNHIGEYMKSVKQEAIAQGKIADNSLAKKVWLGD